MLFAQAGGGFGGGGGPDDELFTILLIVFVVVVLVIAIVIQVMYLLTLSRALRRCHPRNRTMEPGQVWLNLIPCFSIVWLFITVQRIAESLDNEFYDRRIRADGDFGKNLGVTYNVLNLMGAIPYIGAIFSMAGFVCWIIYWVKIAGYSRQLRMDDEDDYGRERDEGDDDDYDRRDRRGRRDRDDDEDDDYDR